MQPFPTIQNYGFQPGFGMYNPMAPYQERLAQLQSQFGSGQYQNQQQFGLNGEIVDSIDVVKAKNVDMSGNVREWSTETRNGKLYSCTYRGGCYDFSTTTDIYTGIRFYANKDSIMSEHAFRPIIYL